MLFPLGLAPRFDQWMIFLQKYYTSDSTANKWLVIVHWQAYMGCEVLCRKRSRWLNNISSKWHKVEEMFLFSLLLLRSILMIYCVYFPTHYSMLLLYFLLLLCSITNTHVRDCILTLPPTLPWYMFLHTLHPVHFFGLCGAVLSKV